MDAKITFSEPLYFRNPVSQAVELHHFNGLGENSDGNRRPDVIRSMERRGFKALTHEEVATHLEKRQGEAEVRRKAKQNAERLAREALAREAQKGSFFAPVVRMPRAAHAR